MITDSTPSVQSGGELVLNGTSPWAEVRREDPNRLSCSDGLGCADVSAISAGGHRALLETLRETIYRALDLCIALCDQPEIYSPKHKQHIRPNQV